MSKNTDPTPLPNIDPSQTEIISTATKRELLDVIKNQAGEPDDYNLAHQFLQSPDPDIKIDVTYLHDESPQLPATAGTVRRTFYKDEKPFERQETFYKLVVTPDKTLEIERTMATYDIEKRHEEEITAERERHARFIRQLRLGDRNALDDAESERRELGEHRDLEIEATRRAERELGFDLVTEQEGRTLIEELKTSVPKVPKKYKWYTY